MQLSVIIVNYNVKYFLEQCLYSVQKACLGIDAEIIVADNNSTDGSREYLEPNFPTVNFIWNNENAGFAKANNQALEKAKGAFILFLNPLIKRIKRSLMPENETFTCPIENTIPFLYKV